MKLLKLGAIVRENISNLDGMLTHVIIYIGGNIEYMFQPRGINPRTMKPIDMILVQGARIVGGKYEEINVPIEILGEKAEDIATGFKGKVTSIIYHINGCLHISIKPEGIVKSTGSPIDSVEFDIRRVKGLKFKPLSEKEMEVSKEKTPSPMSIPSKLLK